MSAGNAAASFAASFSAGGFRAAGVNRVSIGAQSFSPPDVARLGRRHNPADIVDTVRLARQAGRKVLLEASGGITLDTVAATAATGVDFISIGALTRDAAGLDVSLDIV